MRKLLLALASVFFGCIHERKSWVVRDKDGQYQRCLDCGKRLRYSAIDFD
jgi:hypothetical protein